MNFRGNKVYGNALERLAGRKGKGKMYLYLIQKIKNQTKARQMCDIAAALI